MVKSVVILLMLKPLVKKQTKRLIINHLLRLVSLDQFNILRESIQIPKNATNHIIKYKAYCLHLHIIKGKVFQN